MRPPSLMAMYSSLRVTSLELTVRTRQTMDAGLSEGVRGSETRSGGEAFVLRTRTSSTCGRPSTRPLITINSDEDNAECSEVSQCQGIQASSPSDGITVAAADVHPGQLATQTTLPE